MVIYFADINFLVRSLITVGIPVFLIAKYFKADDKLSFRIALSALLGVATFFTLASFVSALSFILTSTGFTHNIYIAVAVGLTLYVMKQLGHFPIKDNTILYFSIGTLIAGIVGSQLGFPVLSTI